MYVSCVCVRKSLVFLLINHWREEEAAIQILSLCYLPYSKIVVNILITGSKRCDCENSFRTSFLEFTIGCIELEYHTLLVLYLSSPRWSSGKSRPLGLSFIWGDSNPLRASPRWAPCDPSIANGFEDPHPIRHTPYGMRAICLERLYGSSLLCGMLSSVELSTAPFNTANQGAPLR